MRAYWSGKKGGDKMSFFGPKKNFKKSTRMGAFFGHGSVKTAYFIG